MAEPKEGKDRRPVGTFNFRVTLRRSAAREAGSGGGERLADGGFQECSGLEIEMDVQEHREGGRNDGTIRLVGRGSSPNLVLKRGMFFGGGQGVSPELWGWLQEILGGRRPVRRYDGVVELLDPRGERAGNVVATWTFARGLPVRVAGPALDARTGEIAIEELHIAHEGLRMEV